ncbi:MAG: LmeA family phospholipid-binding protein [Selenomonadaceae bacterium]|nr:LmeA family phospholipid-binding protein [Selenomonadaceae bacterium]
MKKFLAVIVVVIVALGAAAQFVVPKVLTNYLKNLVTNFTHAQEVSLTLDALPAVKISLGHVDKLHCTAADATIGDLNLKQVDLEGSAIKIDVKEILFPTEGISSHEHTNRCLSSAETLELSGIITADSLRDFLAAKVDAVKNPMVAMSPEGIAVSGKVKILGREADVQLGGQIIARDGDLYFQILHLNVENAVLRRINLDKFLGDINLTEAVKMPFGMQFRTVEMRNGEAFVKATR